MATRFARIVTASEVWAWLSLDCHTRIVAEAQYGLTVGYNIFNDFGKTVCNGLNKFRDIGTV